MPPVLSLDECEELDPAVVLAAAVDLGPGRKVGMLLILLFVL